MKKSVCVFTGTRAEYGLLSPLMREIKQDRELKLQIIASGAHLSGYFGFTYRQIEDDGFVINEKVNISLGKDTPDGVGRSMGIALAGLTKAYAKLKPDIIVILGDRFEAFAAATAAMLSRIPIAHLNGGEATYGLIDEAIRHSITKMSHLHFTSTEEYRRRVIQLGEEPGRVFNVGAVGLDNIRYIKLLSKKTLEEKIGFQFARKNLMVTFHPVTLEDNTSEAQFKNILGALGALEDTHIIFTKSNADIGGRGVNRMIDEYVAKNRDRTKAFTSMGQLNYLSAMQYMDAVVGNSSSGIIEAPSFKIGTLNIGDRQEGRIKADSLIDCLPERESVKSAIKKLYSKAFQQRLRDVTNPYGDGRSAVRIKKILKKRDIRDILKKSFYDQKAMSLK